MYRPTILIITAVFPPEPVVSASISNDIATELSKKNKVTVLCPKPTRPNDFKFKEIRESTDFEVIHTESYTCPKSKLVGRLRESYSFGASCAKYIKYNSKFIDCIYINAWPLVSQFLIVREAKKYGIPCIMHVQDIYPESLVNKIPIGKRLLYKLLLPLDIYLLKNSKTVFCISENMKQTLIQTRKIFAKKIVIVSNWQNEEHFIRFRMNNPIIKKEDGPFIFMYLGNIGPVAGVELLITSFVKARISNSKLIIAGSGSRKKECMDLVNSLKSSNIEFVNVPDGKVPEIQNESDVMLLPVRKNGAMSSIPSKLPAYMFSSKPIIGSLDLDSDTAKAIKESKCGLIVNPENEKELILAMKEVSSMNKQQLIEMGIAGFNYSISNFSKKMNLSKVTSIIESICNDNKRNQ